MTIRIGLMKALSMPLVSMMNHRCVTGEAPFYDR